MSIFNLLFFYFNHESMDRVRIVNDSRSRYTAEGVAVENKYLG